MQDEKPSMSKLDECLDNFLKGTHKETYTYEELEEEIRKSTEKIRLEKLKLQERLISANEKILELQDKLR